MKLVIRVLDAAGNLLGWCEHRALARGDGCLRASGPILVAFSTAGEPALVSVHWADLNVETRVSYPLAAGFVPAGVLLPLYPSDAVLIRAGEPAQGLPPVTIGSSAVMVPVGALGARGT